jgi:hypothetical protein
MKFALMNRRILVGMQKLDRIFNGNDVVVLRLINEIDNCRQGRTLPATGGTGYQHHPVLNIDDLL